MKEVKTPNELQQLLEKSEEEDESDQSPPTQHKRQSSSNDSKSRSESPDFSSASRTPSRSPTRRSRSVKSSGKRRESRSKSRQRSRGRSRSRNRNRNRNRSRSRSRSPRRSTRKSSRSRSPRSTSSKKSKSKKSQNKQTPKSILTSQTSDNISGTRRKVRTKNTSRVSEGDYQTTYIKKKWLLTTDGEVWIYEGENTGTRPETKIILEKPMLCHKKRFNPEPGECFVIPESLQLLKIDYYIQNHTRSIPGIDEKLLDDQLSLAKKKSKFHFYVQHIYDYFV